MPVAAAIQQSEEDVMIFDTIRFDASTKWGFKKDTTRHSALGLRAWLAAGALSALSVGVMQAHEAEFRVTSSTFKNGSQLPTTLADNFLVNGVNVCTADGSLGGNLSPDLSWENAPEGTRSFAVVMFDETASFTHWGMFDIPASTRFLPFGAGAAASTDGLQVNNDFGSHGYEGPCPPAGVAPDAHHYVFTVYALDTKLELPVLANFPQNAETILRALAQAGAEGHVLGRASIGGFFSTTPAP
jgi:Raf kinase inhibitor-like YbhB/YbcL family protein